MRTRGKTWIHRGSGTKKQKNQWEFSRRCPECRKMITGIHFNGDNMKAGKKRVKCPHCKIKVWVPAVTTVIP